MPGRLKLLKILLPFSFLFLMLVLVKSEIIEVPHWFSHGRASVTTQDIPFRGLGKDTLGEEFHIFKEDKFQFPERLGDMFLVKVIVGEEALDNVQSFQGTTFDIARAYIPHYQIANRQAVIWIVEAHNEEDAVELFRRMNHSIMGNDNFFNYLIFYQNGIEIYQVERMGWFNYYYRIGNRLYWAAIQDEFPGEVLSLMLDVF